MVRMFQVIIISCIFIVLPSAAHAASETYMAKRVVIGTYNKILGELGTHDVPWTYIKASHVAVDDFRNLYVLDRRGKRILVFSEKGALIKQITLSNIDFSDKSDELGDEGYIEYQIEVSSNGKYIYVTEGGKENNWAVLDSFGKPIKKNIYLNRLNRRCGDQLRADGDTIEVDNKLSVIKKFSIKDKKEQRRLIDSQNNIYYLNLQDKTSQKVIMSKSDLSGKQLFRKEVENSSMPVGFVGIDSSNSIYIAVDKPRKIVKLSNDGITQAEIVFPDEPFFKGREKCKALCDGTIYCIPTYSALWNANKGNLIKGEYFIYFFEKSRS